MFNIFEWLKKQLMKNFVLHFQALFYEVKMFLLIVILKKIENFH